MCGLIFSSIKRKIGDEGTIVLPTYTPQIGLTLNDYFHESTKTNSGILSDYVMSLDNSIKVFILYFRSQQMALKQNKFVKIFQHPVSV